MEPERRPAARHAHCRSCDTVISPGEEMVTMYTYRCRGSHIHLCLKCAKKIGELAQ